MKRIISRIPDIARDTFNNHVYNPDKRENQDPVFAEAEYEEDIGEVESTFSFFATEGGGLKVNFFPVEQVYRRPVCGVKAPCAWMVEVEFCLGTQVAVSVASCLTQENKHGAHESNRFGHIDTPVHCPLAVLIRSSGPTSNSNRIFCHFFSLRHFVATSHRPASPPQHHFPRQMLEAQPHPLPPPECNHSTLSLASCERPKPPLKFAECRARNFVWVDFCRQIYTCSSRGNLGGHFPVVFWSIFVRCVGRFLVIFWSIFGRQVDFCSFFGRLVVFWSFFGRYLIVFWSFFCRFLVVFWSSYFLSSSRGPSCRCSTPRVAARLACWAPWSEAVILLVPSLAAVCCSTCLSASGSAAVAFRGFAATLFSFTPDFLWCPFVLDRCLENRGAPTHHFADVLSDQWKDCQAHSEASKRHSKKAQS